jgi:hypothetical protein
MAACPAPTEPIPERIVVIGCAGSGKTTLTRALAARLGARHLERDAFGDDEAPGFATRRAVGVRRCPLQRRAACLSARRHRCRAGLSTAGRAAARSCPLGPALVDPPRRWGAHLRPAAVALVGASPPGRLGRDDARCSARGDGRVVRAARAGPCAPAAVHLAAPGGCVAGQPEPVASSTGDTTVRDAKHADVPFRPDRA